MRKIRRYISLISAVIAAAAVVEQLMKPEDERDWHGQILFVPYDFRPLKPARLKERWWNPEDERLFTPHVFGVGWSLNLYRLKEMLAQPPHTNGDG
ncbi:MAG: DUF5808 domain-containing protein [Alphaproteobacteria bacterium]